MRIKAFRKLNSKVKSKSALAQGAHQVNPLPKFGKL